MWGKIDCPSCGGTGNEGKVETFVFEGVSYTNRFPCGDCNGEGTQDVWYDTCKKCGGKPAEAGETPCSRCNGLGFHEPEPAAKVSWYEIIDGR